MIKHLDRKELLKAAQMANSFKSKHLQNCNGCRDAIILLQRYSVIGALPLRDAPIGWIDRAISISLGTSALGKIREFAAKLVFDSWAMPIPVGVRGVTTMEDRRLRFESDDLVFDLRAEKNLGGWSFVAEVTGDNIGAETLLLQADRKTIDRDRSGFHQWRSNRPPKKITLRSPDLIIDIPELSWKKTNRK